MCSIANPEKTVSTLESYLTYEVKTKTTRPNFPGPDFDVKRRYSDFEWLKKTKGGSQLKQNKQF